MGISVCVVYYMSEHQFDLIYIPSSATYIFYDLYYKQLMKAVSNMTCC